jgi:uncharacterized small protein (DUF1192 family)
MIDPDASDWSDLDLLTIAEANERLRAEIATTEADIARADAAGDSVPEDVRRRLAALRKRLAP